MKTHTITGRERTQAVTWLPIPLRLTERNPHFADTFPPETPLYDWKPKPTIEMKGKT
jgi:hypothetical protein